MKYRELADTGILVSEIGFGGWAIGGKTVGATSYGDTNDSVSSTALLRSYDLGINFYDTANVYGAGHSEELIGEAFRSKRHSVVLATKAGMLDNYRGLDFSPKFIRMSLEGSLRRLNTDYVDLFQLHNPPNDIFTEESPILNELQELIKEGKIRAFGASVRSPKDALVMLSCPLLSSLQVNMNLLDWRFIDSGLLARINPTNISLIARTPLASGFLTGMLSKNSEFNKYDHRSLWSKNKLEVWAEVARKMLSLINSEDNYTINVQNSLRFCLSFDAVSCVIPGIMTPEQAEINAMSSELGSLDYEVIELLRLEYNKLLDVLES